jgi:hypothetical protein
VYFLGVDRREDFHVWVHDSVLKNFAQTKERSRCLREEHQNIVYVHRYCHAYYTVISGKASLYAYYILHHLRCSHGWEFFLQLLVAHVL